MTEEADDLYRRVVEGWIEESAMAGAHETNPSSDQCRVCREPAVKHLVNKMLARGFTVPTILATVSDENLRRRCAGQPEITRDCLYNHRQRHFEIQEPAAAIWRQIQEKNAAQTQQDWHLGVGTILSAMSYYETMMVKGYETLIDPMCVVDPKDGAWAAQRLHELTLKDEDAYERARLTAEMSRVVRAVREFVPQEQWPALQAALKGEAPPAQQVPAAEVIKTVEIRDDDEEG